MVDWKRNDNRTKSWRILLVAVTVPLLHFSPLYAEATRIPQACLSCHEQTAPPLRLVYRRYLMLYSSHARIAEKMRDFLVRPSMEGSSMPEGMKSRFNPQNHPAFDPATAATAVEALIRQEDISRRFVYTKKPTAP